MGGNLFDVFVVGASDSSPTAETRLAAALATRHGLPLATVAKAISAKNLRAGQSLDQAQAQALVRQLQSMGAVTVIRQSSPASRTLTSAQSDADARTPSLLTPDPLPSLPRAPAMTIRQGLAPSSNLQQSGGWPVAQVALGATGEMPVQAADLFPPLSATGPAATTQTGAPNRFEPRPAVTPAVATTGRPNLGEPPVAPSQRSASTRAYAFDSTHSGPKLELARGGGAIAQGEQAAFQKRKSLPETNLGETGEVNSSSVAVDEDPKNLSLVRCVQHGLYYDKTKASGCRKCLSSARALATNFEAKTAGFRLGNFQRRPAQRAFLGLAFALVIGLLPAAYYAFGPGTSDARAYRVEQELLSSQPGTEEILRRFDELDAAVAASCDRSTRNTGIVWVAVASVALFGWFKVT